MATTPVMASMPVDEVFPALRPLTRQEALAKMFDVLSAVPLDVSPMEAMFKRDFTNRFQPFVVMTQQEMEDEWFCFKSDEDDSELLRLQLHAKSGIFCDSLKDLIDIDLDEAIAALSSWLQTCTSVQEVSISSFPIGIAGLRNLAAALSKIGSLQSLSFDDCGLSYADESFFLMLQLTSTHLRYLSLERNLLGNNCLSGLGPILRSHESLSELHLKGCGIGDGALAPLAEALKDPNKPSALRVLVLSHNNIGVSGLHRLFEALATSNISLESLDLSFNRPRCTPVPFDLPKWVPHVSSRLKTLNVAFFSAQKDATVLALGLESFCCLEHLDLSYADLSEYGAKSVAEALAVSSTSKVFRSLKVAKNRVCCAGAIALLRVPRLAHLDLTDTGIEDYDGHPKLKSELIVALAASTVKSLVLTNNRLDREIVGALCQRLRANTLESLELGGSICHATIGEEGFEMLLQDTESNLSLLHFDLGRYQEQRSQKFELYCKRNRAIRTAMGAVSSLTKAMWPRSTGRVKDDATFHPTDHIPVGLIPHVVEALRAMTSTEYQARVCSTFLYGVFRAAGNTRMWKNLGSAMLKPPLLKQRPMPNERMLNDALSINEPCL